MMLPKQYAAEFIGTFWLFWLAPMVGAVLPVAVSRWFDAQDGAGI